MENPVEDHVTVAGVAGEVLITVAGPPSSEEDIASHPAHNPAPTSSASSSLSDASSWAGLGTFSTALVGVGDGTNLVLSVLPDSDIEYLNVAANLKARPPRTYQFFFFLNTKLKIEFIVLF
jgi:hypothetical protein